MTVGDEDVPIRCNHDVSRLIKEARRRPTLPSLPQGHHQPASWIELEHLVSLAVGASRIGHPEVPGAVSRGAVRKHEQALAERLEQLAAGVVLQDRRLGPAGAGVLEAALDDEDAAVWRRLDGGDRRPFHAWRQL